VPHVLAARLHRDTVDGLRLFLLDDVDDAGAVLAVQELLGVVPEKEVKKREEREETARVRSSSRRTRKRSMWK
jgi:hypothetical protein